MKDNIRVSLSIVVWGLLLFGFVVAGIRGIMRMEDSDVCDVAVGDIAEVEPYRIERVEPDIVGLDSAHLQRVGDVVGKYVEQGAIPGAVVAVVRGDKLAYIEAFGEREHGVAMTIDTRFDLASLTKPVVVATAIMQLVERGELRLSERVNGIIPDFDGWSDKERDIKHDITILDLMTHTSNLPPYISYERLKREYPDSTAIGREELLDYIAHCDRELPEEPGQSRYSCLNYIALGDVIERITGSSLDVYATENIFALLDMSDTCYLPDMEYTALCAPTSAELCGLVHDPLAREAMAGVSGNAGLFSTAEDLAIYAAMLLNGGVWQGREILSPLGVRTMLSVPAGYELSKRTPGWKVASEVNATAGDLLASDATLVHTGATGTSIVLAPEHSLAIIILTNRTLATATATDILDLRSKVCNVVAAACDM